MNNITIRKANENELDKLVEIWYEASVISHNFISEDYWKENKTAMREMYLPNAELYVSTDNNNISGFVALKDNYLAAIFVSPALQGKGIGSSLLEYVKNLRDELSLRVYKKNVQAVGFYKSNGFSIIEEMIDEATGENEILMKWGKRWNN